MKKLFLILIVLALSTAAASAKTAPRGGNGTARRSQLATLSGIVYEAEGNDSIPLEFAIVALPDYEMATTTREGGVYELKNVPAGRTTVKVTYLGKHPVEKTINITAGSKMNFKLENENFRMKEVTVTAQASQAGQATASVIGRTAIDHMQATSLSDVMSLLPGNLTREPNLSSAKSATIRGTSSFNSLGTAIIQDGAPMSNNANLSGMGSPLVGTVGSLAGGASPSAGIDLRSISTDNIESVEVIRGIPSVEHGDLTSGAVIINSKAGTEPLRITAKANPKVYAGSVSKGFRLGRNGGALNINADYAHNTNDPVQSYLTYQRLSARALYSKELFSGFRTNTSFNFRFGKDKRAKNPDDTDNNRASSGEEYSYTLNTNGNWSINKGWLRSLRYVLSGTFSNKQSYYEENMVSNYNPYSGTMTDGAVLSNTPGKDIYDAEGNKITNFGPEDAHNYAYIIPANYFSHYDLDSKEVNVFAKVVGTLFKQSGVVNNRILFGADYRTDGNVGHGKIFDREAPPERTVSSGNGVWRPRDYSDIPFIHQFGAFLEENFSWQIGLHQLAVQAGVRYDHASEVGGIVSPRVNASFEVIPNVLKIRGGYGVTSKMPTLVYLHPESAYFEYKNIDESASTKVPDDEKTVITTTKKYDTENKDLKIATNRKVEAGFDLRLGRMTFSATAYRERLKNGYTLNKTLDTYAPFQWDVYARNAENQFELKKSNTVLSSWYTPTNDYAYDNRGIEFDFNFGRIDAINTSISLNGAYTHSKSWNDGYTFYEPNNDKDGDKRTDVAIYDRRSITNYADNFSTALRVTHNLPSIGFVVTLTAETVWKDSDWGKYGNDSIPVGYISLQDGKANYFEPGQYNSPQDLLDAKLNHLVKHSTHPKEIKESYNPYFCFNINVTKEIGDMMRVSFFANNMFRSYPRRESKRNPGTFTRLNNRFYFGIELALTL